LFYFPRPGAQGGREKGDREYTPGPFSVSAIKFTLS
jgi:hypothetical protein